MKKILIILSITICVLVIVGINLQKRYDDYSWKNDVSNDEHLTSFVYYALHDISINIYNMNDEESINEYNNLFDGKEHYLHDIDENSEFGKQVLETISRKAYGEYGYDIKSIEEYESKIKTVENKNIVIQYTSDGYLKIFIPNSVDTYNKEIATGAKVEVKDGKYKFF